MSRGYEENQVAFDDSGMEDLQNMLQQLAKRATEENALKAMETGAKAFISDLLRLPGPRRKVAKSGYTHMVDSFCMRRTKGKVEVGWGKYYGSMVERGTRKMSPQPHFKPTWEKNQERYYREIIKKFEGGRI